ncbi:hypothetical protein ATG66_0894 [Vibrio sp. ES.051]|uniref:hypothetical protein n=1 Tax=Vibrio sp. ES.051 TaxID=1761909 RepID=UPI000BF3DFD1|nr:hypothetical protein [Vibrio sp. ES.051]PFG58349.1 hypothetical protein ATG66_0894 [Vibrio sp. ES.051]
MEEKLKILFEAGIIDHDTRVGVLKASEMICDKYSLPTDLEQLSMAMVHLANAAMRIKNGTPITNGLNEDILEEIQSDDSFNCINQFNDTLCQLVGLVSVPREENSFLLSNLYSLSLL